MHIYYYDKTFDGLLTVVFDAYTSKIFPDQLLGKGDQHPLLALSTHHVLTDPEKSQRVFNGLKKKISASAMNSLLHAWVSETEGTDMLLLQCMRKIFDGKVRSASDYSDPTMLEISQVAARVRSEAHRLLGFTRFQKTSQGIYMALIGPRHNVLPLILDHFRDRFSNDQWGIYDVVREYGAFYDGQTIRELYLENNAIQNGALHEALLAEGEQTLQDAWKGYCGALSIAARKNPRLQRSFMPERFWHYMTEKQ